MKISEKWLREWVNPKQSIEKIAERLTMAGVEVESITPVAQFFSGVCVAQVVAVDKHPDAERLQVCQVDAGDAELLTVVCGARNVFKGMKVAFAREGAVLPDGTKIKKAKLRGVASSGMLCSARELSLAETSEGIIQFADDAPIGLSVRDYLQLADTILDVAVTPDRGDCLSVLGLSRDIAALMECERCELDVPEVVATINDSIPVKIMEPAFCPRYVGRIIRGITVSAVTPLWLSERLRRAGIRCIHPVVDVLNYVCLELGQPMHAFDLAMLSDGVTVRRAKEGETLALLDGQTVTLHPETLVIADAKNPQAIAGVMGGSASAVSNTTQAVFLESAFFTPICIAQAVRRYHIHSDSSYRFERGVDPALPMKALQRATQLILEIAGGAPGPVIEVADAPLLPVEKKIELSLLRLQQVGGISIPEEVVARSLQRLGFLTEKVTQGFEITVPTSRSDISSEIDLIQEVLRIYGYEKIHSTSPMTTVDIKNHFSVQSIKRSSIMQVLCQSGYHEVITYSFIDEHLQKLFDPKRVPRFIMNPMSAEMNVMRTSLLPGLVNVFNYNLKRQQERIRLFEVGICFLPEEENAKDIKEQNRLGMLIAGDVLPLQWGQQARHSDFYDLKGDIENLLQLTDSIDKFRFCQSHSSVLHPGQSADIYYKDHYIGTFGMLHPAMMQALDISTKVGVAELRLDQLGGRTMSAITPVSQFPAIRRDIALLVAASVPAEGIQATIKEAAGDVLQDVALFDVWQGKGVPEGQKSMAFALTLQDVSRTLTDDEVAEVMQNVIAALQRTFHAELRG